MATLITPASSERGGGLVYQDRTQPLPVHLYRLNTHYVLKATS